MQIIELDTQEVAAFSFLGSKKPIGVEYDPDDDRYMSDPDDILRHSPVLAIIVAEVPDDMMSSQQDLQVTWAQLWSANEEAEDYLSLDEVLESWNLPGVLALEVTTFGMACGPISETVFYLIKEEDWNTVSLVGS
jgi:hypothetical protein